MSIIDTHAHLDHVPDVENALARAAEAGVTDIIAVSTDLKAIKKNLEIKTLVGHSALWPHVCMSPSASIRGRLKSKN